MSDYIEREAALSAQNKSMNLAECRKRLERIPAADVRPVVLCRECKHRPEKEYGRIVAPKDADAYADGYMDYKCPFVCDDSWYNRMPADDDYCSRGEKREER